MLNDLSREYCKRSSFEEGIVSFLIHKDLPNKTEFLLKLHEKNN